MTPRPTNKSTSGLGTASVVVLCMSVTAGTALAIEEVWMWLPWTIVITAASIGAGSAVAARRASDLRGLDTQ